MQAWRGSVLTAMIAAAAALSPALAEAQQRPAASAASRPAPSLTEGVAAIVNDEVISTWDVRQRSALILLSSGIQPDARAMEEVRPQALRSLVDERLQLQEAKQYEVVVDDQEVATAFEDIARQNQITPAQFAMQLAQSGVNASSLMEQLRADMAWRRLVGGRFGSRVRISEGRIRETIERITASATSPQYLISEILLAAETPDEQAQAVAAGERLLNEIAQGASFPLVARQFSSAPTAASGGDTGWLAQAEVRPELLAIVQQLQPGQISRPIPTASGVYIIAVRDRRAGVDPSVVGRVTLLQISAPAERRAALERELRGVSTCEEAQTLAGRFEGAQALELGEATLGDLTPAVRDLVASARIGQPTAVTDEGASVASYVVCARNSGGVAPTPDEVEDRLYAQEVAMLSQRYLRNLRREATIITR